jgi:mRNA interferase RelE/StbE
MPQERYGVELEPAVLKALRGFPRRDVERIMEKVEALAEDPRPANCVKLAGGLGYRLRSGNFRIVYRVEDADRVVIVTRVGDRKDVYKRR